MYFDIHTHNASSTKDVVRIINIFTEEAKALKTGLTYSIGIHPSFIVEEGIEEELKLVAEYARKPNVIAVGEIGLDKYSNVDMELQKEVFLSQLKIAESLKMPVILHCVKCFSEIVSLKINSPTPWIIHGFRGKPELASQLVQKDFYLSFGSAVLSPTPPLQQTLTAVPLDRIFLETDDSGADIKQIYAKVSKIKKISIAALIDAIKHNWEIVFNVRQKNLEN